MSFVPGPALAVTSAKTSLHPSPRLRRTFATACSSGRSSITELRLLPQPKPTTKSTRARKELNANNQSPAAPHKSTAAIATGLERLCVIAQPRAASSARRLLTLLVGKSATLGDRAGVQRPQLF
eukprot:g17313.t1